MHGVQEAGRCRRVEQWSVTIRGHNGVAGQWRMRAEMTDGVARSVNHSFVFRGEHFEMD